MGIRIDVEKAFSRADDPPLIKPPDYTDYPSGDQRVYTLGKLSGFITQEGLKKRLVDAKVITAEQRQNWVANGSTSVSVKPVKNIGVLAVADKFFHWLNRVLGEK